MPSQGDPEHDSTALITPLLQESCPHEKLSIDEALQTWVGEFGCAQATHFSLVNLAWCTQGLLIFTMIFCDQTPSWHCTSSPRPLNNMTSLGHIVRLQYTNVSLISYDAISLHAGGFSPSCNSTSSICTIDASLWAWTGGKGVSTVSQWGLICAQSYKVGLVQSLFFAGIMLGAGVCGSLSDSSLGRKGVLLIACGLGSLLSLLTAFAPNYWVYLTLRAVTGFSVGGMGPTAFLLATEVIGPSKRGPASMSIFFFFSLSIILLSTVAYFIASWRLLYLLSSAPCFLYCLLVLPFVCESPRWYLAQGKADNALAILKQIAVKNGRTIPPCIILDTEHAHMEDGTARAEGIESRRKATRMDIFRVSTTRKRMIAMLFIWLSNGLCYYGINLNVPNVGAGNISFGLILNAVVEMPAYLISAMMLQRCGRRLVLVCAMLLSGVSCLVGAVMGSSGVRTACGAVAMFGVAASYNLVYLYMAELFPTEVRNAALGFGVQAAQMGAIAAPLVAALSHICTWLPFTIFCTATLLASCLAGWLPETLERRMYETMHGMLK